MWINNWGITLEIVGFVLMLNALRRPIPPKNSDIRLNIAYLESVTSTTRYWVNRVGIGLILAGIVTQLIYSLHM